MKLYIKNMVCNRCIMAVEGLLERSGFKVQRVGLGEVELSKKPGIRQLEQFESDLEKLGFELLNDRKKQQIEKIRNLLVNLVQGGEIEEHFSLTDYLSRTIGRDYSSLSKLFSEVEGITIEQFFILQKIEKVKEWLVYEEYNLGEISFKLGYSSLAHLSAQFKKVTGLTPSHFKKIGSSHRHPLDHLPAK